MDVGRDNLRLISTPSEVSPPPGRKMATGFYWMRTTYPATEEAVDDILVLLHDVFESRQLTLDEQPLSYFRQLPSNQKRNWFGSGCYIIWENLSGGCQKVGRCCGSPAAEWIG